MITTLLTFVTLSVAGDQAPYAAAAQPSAGTRRAFAEASQPRREFAIAVTIDGDGMFGVQLPKGGEGYTRDGRFRVGADGKLVTNGGYVLVPEVSIPANATEVSVDAQGRVTGRIPGERAAASLGQINLVRFINPARLSAIGRNLYQQTIASGRPILGTPGSQRFGSLKQDPVAAESQADDLARTDGPASLRVRDGSKIEIRCRDDAQVRGADVLLADLAEIKADDPEIVARLLEMSFGPRPGFGFSRQFTRNDLLLKLTREGLKSAELQISGADRVIVQPLFRTIGPQELIEVATPVLQAALEVDGSPDVEIEPTSTLTARRFPPGRMSFDLRPRVRDGRLQPTSAIVDVAVWIDGTEVKNVPVAFKLRRFHHVLAASTAIRKGDPLGEHNLVAKRIEAPYGTSHFVTDLGAVRGKIAARDIRAAQQINLGAVTLPAVIRRGDQVSLVVSRGRIAVTTKAIAQDDGRVGERVIVTNLTSGKVTQATVRGPGVVTIEPTR